MAGEVVVTVVGARRSGHLALPGDALVGNLTADLVRRYGSPGAGGLVLVRENGTVLQPWMSLEQGGVSHGERLALRTVAGAFAEPATRRRLFTRLWPVSVRQLGDLHE